MLGEIIGSVLGYRAAKKNTRSAEAANQQNAELQREFAQNAISWKAADAKRAGLHPLAALGASTVSASPSYVGTNPGGAQKALAAGVQSFSKSFNNELAVETIRGKKLENDLLEQQIIASKMKRETLRANSMQDDLGPARAFKYDDGSESWIVGRDTGAQEWEDQYGDLPGWYHGAMNYINDWRKYNRGKARDIDMKPKNPRKWFNQ